MEKQKVKGKINFSHLECFNQLDHVQHCNQIQLFEENDPCYTILADSTGRTRVNRVSSWPINHQKPPITFDSNYPETQYPPNYQYFSEQLTLPLPMTFQVVLGILSKNPKPQSNHEKNIKPKLGTFYWISGQYFSRLSKT